MSTRSYFTTLISDAALTAPGVTAAIGSATTDDLARYSAFSTQIVVTNIDTSITMRMEVSHDGTNWANRNQNDADYTVTANGTYVMFWENKANRLARFRFVSEAGGTAATVTVNCDGWHMGD